MTTPPLHWRGARLPPDTALFAIGDLHAYDALLRPMLDAIEEKIAALPPGVQAQVIFLGDYVDRGPNGPGAIDRLLAFEQRMNARPNVVTTFLCGNHDEIFKRLLEAKSIAAALPAGTGGKNDYAYLTTSKEGEISLRALESWLFSGGGISTVNSYLPGFDQSLLDHDNKSFDRRRPDVSMEAINGLMRAFVSRVPPAHKEFFARIYPNYYVLLGDYLLTHAGIDPGRTLSAQGIGPGATLPTGKDYIDGLMIRDIFLWHDGDHLPHCDYVVVHGHTPSAVERDQVLIADGRKHYRLCIDTGIYEPNGALTCFMRHGATAGFIAVNRTSPGKAVEYSLPA